LLTKVANNDRIRSLSRSKSGDFASLSELARRTPLTASIFLLDFDDQFA
jgi:hypothetical protein